MRGYIRQSYPEFFNDVFGPIMQPGSSSHTAAPCRLGYLAGNLLGEPPALIQVLLDREGSFSGTFGIMAEDRAMVAGVLGILPHDVRLFDAMGLADEAGIEYRFDFTDMKESAHINAMKFVLTGRSGRVVTLVGDSTGGGMIETRVINGFPLRVRGDTFVLLLADARRAVSQEQVEALQSELPAFVEVEKVEVVGKGILYAFQTSEPPAVDHLRQAFSGLRLDLLQPVLPVVRRLERKPQLFDTMVRWREVAQERGVPLWEAAIQYEVDASSWPAKEVIAFMRMLGQKMRRQTRAAYDEDVSAPLSPFKANFTAMWDRHMGSPRRLSDPLTANTIKWAYGAGAGIPGVEVVAGPMGSGGGYIYAALSAVQEARGLSEQDLLRGLFIAAGVGAIAFTRTEPTGECIGCGGECGVCGAMAAAAIAEMAGGTPQQVENAASLSLQSAIGLPCDPIPGGFGQPCRSRVLAATCLAHVFADLALAGVDAVLPLHEVIDVADAVGRRLSPDLLCTSRGGACDTPTARKQAAAYHKWLLHSRPEERPPGNLI